MPSGRIHIALWDIAGKAAAGAHLASAGRKARESLTPYASLQPEVSSLDAYRASMAEWAAKARGLGFQAAKLEATFDVQMRSKGLHGSDDWVVEVARAAREAAGPEMTLMVDVQYAFDSVERALRVAEGLAAFDIYFLETPLWVDDLAGYAELRGAHPFALRRANG